MIADDQSRFGLLELSRLERIHQTLEAMRLACDKDRHALTAVRFRKTQLDLHPERFRQLRETALQCRAV